MAGTAAGGRLREVAAAYALTEAQSGLWFAQRIEPTNPILNTGQYLDISGPLDIQRFRRAVGQAAREAEALSLRFTETAEGVTQFVDRDLTPAMEFVDLCGDSDPDGLSLALIARDETTPVDLERGALARFVLFRLALDRFRFYERIHHIATDGFGMVLVTDRIADLYNGRTGTAFPPLAVVIADGRAYAASQKRAADRAFWMDELAGLGDIAGMAPGRPVSAHSFHRATLQLGDAQLASLRALAKRFGVTWPDVLTGLTAAYCRRFTGSTEIVVGVPFMGRLGSPAARVPSMLMNVLPLRFAADETAPLFDVFADLARRLTRLRRHGRYRSEQMRRDVGLIGGSRRLYGPIVNVQPFDLPPRLEGMETRLVIRGAGSVDDITFTFRGDAQQLLTFEVDSNPALYSQAETEAHAERLLAFLDAAGDAETLAGIPTTLPAEADREIRAFNETAHPVPETTLTALVERRFAEMPDATALEFGDESLTFAELDRRSAALAALLAKQGAGPDRIVGIALPRSLDLLVGLVAILRSGAAYMPLDADHPSERIGRIAATAEPVAILATPDHAPLFRAFAPVLTPSEWPRDGAAPAAMLDPGALAYVIYTSGSTGEPKGVAIEHGAIVNRLAWMAAKYGFGPQDRILQKTPATFDVSVWEFFLPLITGATLVIAPPGAHRDPAVIADIIRRKRVTTAHFVPSMLSAFLASPAAAGLQIARVFCSGEELTAEQRDRFHATVTGDLHNLYGPTEAAVDVSFWEASPGDRSAPVPIGWPVWNTRLYILDDAMRPVPPGVAGHLWIAGRQVARGYLGRHDLTAERFLPDPFHPGERMYRTGDLARRRPDGAVLFLGRSDFQVKIRGLRIELGEIEAAIMATGLVRDCAVLAREDRPGDRRLAAYVVADEGFAPDTLREAVAARLPDYMVPSSITPLEALPVTGHGKLDRARLPVPEVKAQSGRRAETPTEIALCEIAADVLDLAEMPGANVSFFDIGGDSLSAVHLLLAFQARFGRDPGLGTLFEHTTLAALAAAIDAEDAVLRDGLGPIIRLRDGGADVPPLFLIHPAGGIAWCYRGLAARLAPGRAVLGLQSPTLDPAAPRPASLDALAEHYADKVEAEASDGPVHLAGWSVGGILAQAMACVLARRGRQVGLVGLLDAYPAECWQDEPEPDETAALRALIAIAGLDPDAYRGPKTRRAVTEHLRLSGSTLGSLPDAALDGVVSSVLGTNRLVRGHSHRHYPGTLTHLRAARDHADGKLHTGLWASHAERISQIDVPFQHKEMTSAEASDAIAPLLDAGMIQAEAQFSAIQPANPKAGRSARS